MNNTGVFVCHLYQIPNPLSGVTTCRSLVDVNCFKREGGDLEKLPPGPVLLLACILPAQITKKKSGYKQISTNK